MSAIRAYGPDGRPEWRKADDGCSPQRAPQGSIDGQLVVGRSTPHSEDRRTGAHSRREPRA